MPNTSPGCYCSRAFLELRQCGDFLASLSDQVLSKDDAWPAHALQGDLHTQELSTVTQEPTMTWGSGSEITLCTARRWCNFLLLPKHPFTGVSWQAGDPGRTHDFLESDNHTKWAYPWRSAHKMIGSEHLATLISWAHWPGARTTRGPLERSISHPT